MDSRARSSRNARLSNLGCALKQRQEIGSFHDLNAVVVPQGQQVSVTTDDVLCLPNDGAFQNRVIVGVGSDDFQSARNRDEPGEGANLIGNFRCFVWVKAAFELKL